MDIASLVANVIVSVAISLLILWWPKRHATTPPLPPIPIVAESQVAHKPPPLHAVVVLYGGLTGSIQATSGRA